MAFYFTPAGSEFAIPWRRSFQTVEAQPDAIIRADHPHDERSAAVNRGQELFEANLDLIRDVTASICRKNRFRGADAEDFQSHVYLKLIERDYYTLNEFEGRSTLKRFLQIVLTNFLRDYRNALWGKLRPSAKARSLGPLAIALERSLHLEGMSLHEAFEHLRTNLQWTITFDELDRIATQLPPRTRRRFTSDDVLVDMPSGDPAVDDIVASRELEADRCRVLETVDGAIDTFDDQDRLILKYRSHEGRTVAWIARTMKLDQRQLYPRLQHLLKQLGKVLEEQGFDRETVRKLLDWDRL